MALSRGKCVRNAPLNLKWSTEALNLKLRNVLIPTLILK